MWVNYTKQYWVFVQLYANVVRDTSLSSTNQPLIFLSLYSLQKK